LEKEQSDKSDVIAKIEASIKLNESLKCQLANMKTCNENLSKQIDSLTLENKELGGQARQLTTLNETTTSEKE
jgi:hypothetical protein